MGLFSRRKKQDDDVNASQEQSARDAEQGSQQALSGADTATSVPIEGSPDAGSSIVAPDAGEPSAGAPPVNIDISVQAFRGLGAPSGPEVALPVEDVPSELGETPAPAPEAAKPAVAVERVLPLAPVDPPEQTETIPGMKDNVLLREARAQIEEGATHEQLLGVLRQALQGHLSCVCRAMPVSS